MELDAYEGQLRSETSKLPSLWRRFAESLEHEASLDTDVANIKRRLGKARTWRQAATQLECALKKGRAT